jgi:CDP-paratose 2-epimerase
MPKVLVTGGCGFLGSHVCELFKQRGWNVVAYDNLTKFEYSRAGFKDEVRTYNLHYLESIGVPTIVADIRDLKTLRKAVNCDVDYIIHCAAQPAMTIAIENPQLDFENNIQGTLNVLLVASNSGNVPVVNCSSIHVYGNSLNKKLEETPTRFVHEDFANISEVFPVLPNMCEVSPLHVSKYAAELYTRAFTSMYELPAATFRLSGMYGPRQFGGEDHGWVANFAIRNVLEQPIKVFGTDKQVRDILYATDAAEAFWMWFENGKPSGVYNIGGDLPCCVSIRDVLNIIQHTTAYASPEEILPKRKGDLWWYVSDTDKAFTAFKWQPQILPADGITYLIDWIKKERSLF